MFNVHIVCNSFLSSIDVESHNPFPLESSVLVGTTPVFGSDIICNSWSSLLVDIVFFRLSFKVFKTRMVGRDFHTLTKNVSFSFPSDVESHNLLLFGPNVLANTNTLSFLQSMWDPQSTPTGPNILASTSARIYLSNTICNSSSSLLPDIVLFRLFLSDFPSRFLKRVY